MKRIIFIYFILFGVCVKAQTTYLLDAFEYSTNAAVSTAYSSSEAYGEILSHDMTSNVLPSPYVAVASTEYSTSYKAYQAFDYNINGDTYYWQANTSTGTIRQYTVTYFIPTSYAVTSPSANYATYSPKNWNFECSTDGTNWTTCGTETNQTTWGASETRYYSCTNVQGQYRYFRLNVSANNGGTYLAVGEFYVTGGQSFVWCESTTKKQGSYCLRLTQTSSANGSVYTRTVSPTINLSGLKYIHWAMRSVTATGNIITLEIRDAGGTTTSATYSVTSTGVWYQCNMDLSAVTDANKDAINRITITIGTAASNTVYIDNFFITINNRAVENEQIYGTSNIIGGN